MTPPVNPQSTESSPTAYPASHESIFRSLSVSPEGGPVSRFGDDTWDLQPMVSKQTVGLLRITFSTLPAAFRQTARRIVWTWINELTPIDQLVRFANMRDRLQGSSIVSNFIFLRKFLAWLDEVGVSSLSAVEAVHFRGFASMIGEHATVRRAKTAALFAVTRTWLIAPYLPEDDRLRIPPWEDPAADEEDQIDFLVGPNDRHSSGNKTAPIHPQTMSPLIVAALRFVEIYAPDILAAVSDKVQLQTGIRDRFEPEHHATVAKYLQDLAASGEAIPSTDTHRRGVAIEYLCATLEVSRFAVTQLRGMPLGHGAPMPTAITGIVEGRPWCDVIDYYEVPRLRRMLILACYIVTAYLSGMRSEEARALRRGCCTAIQPDSTTPPHFEIRGMTFKGVEDEMGNLLPGGEERERPWLAVEPVAKAIAVAESLHPRDYVFDSYCMKGAAGAAKEGPVTAVGVLRGVRDFISWWNTHCLNIGRHHELIPPDPHGEVAPIRFRRTLAWFIYRVPGGRIALGLQYGHLRGFTTDGYASRVVGGLYDIFPVEEAMSIADNLREAADRLDQGERVSGPAASRYLTGVRTFQKSFGGAFLSRRQMSALQRDPALRIYDNPARALACVYDQAKALCHPERKSSADLTRTPDVTRCRDNCGNAARTDSHAAILQRELECLREEVASPLTPEPIRARLATRITRREQELQEHFSNRGPDE